MLCQRHLCAVVTVGRSTNYLTMVVALHKLPDSAFLATWMKFCASHLVDCLEPCLSVILVVRQTIASEMQLPIPASTAWMKSDANNLPPKDCQLSAAFSYLHHHTCFGTRHKLPCSGLNLQSGANKLLSAAFPCT